MVDKKVSEESCGCAFLVDESGQPIVECSTPEEQDKVYQALRTHSDINIRVAVAPAIPAIKEAGEADEEVPALDDDQGADDGDDDQVDDDDLALGFADDDFDDDFLDEEGE